MCREKLDKAVLNGTMTSHIQNEFLKICRDLLLDPAHSVALGMHGDGVPYSKKAGSCRIKKKQNKGKREKVC